MESRVLLSAYTLSTLGDFGINASGANPQSTLVADAGGNLYGTASAGGQYGRGTVFEVASGSNTITTLLSFNGTNGATPLGALALDPSGNLYGATSAGGPQNAGTIFEIAKGANTITTLAALGGAYGSNPVGGVALNASGDLFGMTKAGGANYDGVLFEIPNGSKSATVLVSFNGADGSSPEDTLTFDASGNIWGTTYSGGANNDGTVFEIAKGSSTITNVTSFARSGNGGIYPEGGVTLDGSGNVFGTTHGGGAFGVGTVFEIPHASATVTTLATLSNPGELSPQGPESSLVLDNSGNLYGTTDQGGTHFNGTVFELSAGSNTVTTLASFTNGRDAFATPTQATLTSDGSDNLYVVTNLGGPNSNGTILEIAAGSQVVTPVASFNATNGPK